MILDGEKTVTKLGFHAMTSTSVIEGARNHLQANCRLLDFRFEIRA